jgi:hypothetical protein
MVSSDATRIASIFTIFLAVATASNICKKDSDFISSHMLMPPGFDGPGGISCGTLAAQFRVAGLASCVN